MVNVVSLIILIKIYRQEVKSLNPSIESQELDKQWHRAIRRLEVISLTFYICLLFTTVFLFFYHDFWYCAIGHNPCGQPNLKCPWMKSDPTHPSCRN